jgi:hypothetical protein
MKNMHPYNHIAALATILAHHNARKYLDFNNLPRDIVDFALCASQYESLIKAVPIHNLVKVSNGHIFWRTQTTATTVLDDN